MRKPLLCSLVLDAESKARLEMLYPFSDDWKVYCHHMTIAFRPSVDEPIFLWAQEHEGDAFNLEIKRYGASEYAAAVEVETEVPSNNRIKHITLAVNIPNNGRPKDSNNIANWEDVPDMVLGKLRGFVIIDWID